MSNDTSPRCLDCDFSQQYSWERLCLRWMPPRGVTPGQEACKEYRWKGWPRTEAKEGVNRVGYEWG